MNGTSHSYPHETGMLYGRGELALGTRFHGGPINLWPGGGVSAGQYESGGFSTVQLVVRVSPAGESDHAQPL
jgi:hypothetical protein